MSLNSYRIGVERGINASLSSFSFEKEAGIGSTILQHAPKFIGALGNFGVRGLKQYGHYLKKAPITTLLDTAGVGFQAYDYAKGNQSLGGAIGYGLGGLAARRAVTNAAARWTGVGNSALMASKSKLNRFGRHAANMTLPVAGEIGAMVAAGKIGDKLLPNKLSKTIPAAPANSQYEIPQYYPDNVRVSKTKFM